METSRSPSAAPSGTPPPPSVTGRHPRCQREFAGGVSLAGICMMGPRGRPVRDICPGGFLPVSLPPVPSGQGWVGAGPPGLQTPWALGGPAGTNSSGSLDGAEAPSSSLPALLLPSASGVTFTAAGSSLGVLGSRGAWPGLCAGPPSTSGSDREERLGFAADDRVTWAVVVPAGRLHGSSRH